MKLKLLCEYMESPVGLVTTAPLFSWALEETGGLSQSAYRILVSDSIETLKDGCLWDSGVVKTETQRKCFYGGKPLETAGVYYWTAEITLQDGTVLSGQPQRFMMGLLGEDALWQAMWIGGAVVDASCYWYRREFSLKKPLRRAAAFVISPCYCELSVNGKKADDTVLNNVHADYNKTAYYATYDITSHMQEQNTLGLVCGFGWHNLREAEDGVGWGDNVFSMQVLLAYEDGTREWLLSDLSGWKYTVEGPLLYNSIYNGEIYDARKELPGWDCCGFDDSLWHYPVEREAMAGEVMSQYLEPIKVVEERAPQKVYALPDGSYTLDFGQNFAGWVRLRIKGEKGQRIELKPAELMHEDKSVNTVSLRRAHPCDVYILKGEGEEVYEPRFTFHGFRYVQVFGLKEAPKEGMLTGCVVRSAVERVGDFTCDDPILRQLYSNIVWTEASNLHGLPTDCPQRDERLGWLNDMTVRNECALYSYKLFQLYAKWMRDIRGTQGEKTGAITDTAPFRRYGIRPADPVSSSFLLIPWNLYLHYGDSRVIEENYEALQKWVAYLKRNSIDGIMRYCTMGDWAAPIHGTDPNSSGGGAISKITPTVLMGTGYLYYDCILMEKMAKVLGKEDDADFYAKEAQFVKEAFLKTFFKKEEGYFAANSQAANIFPLYLGIVPDEEKERVLESLCRNIEETFGGHLTTGNLCSRYGIEVLFQNGREDLAWYLLTQTEYPGWGYMIKNGATTVWERWEKVTEPGPLDPMASHNHPMNGAVGVCLHKYLAGILPDEAAPGFQTVIFRPIVPQKAQHVEASLQTVRGKVESAWKKENGHLMWNITVPEGSRAKAYLPVKGFNKESLAVSSDVLSFRKGNVLQLAEKAAFDAAQMCLTLPGGSYTFEISD